MNETRFTGDSGLTVEVKRSFGYDGEWDVMLLAPKSSMWTVMPIRFVERGDAEAFAVELLKWLDEPAAEQLVRDELRYAELTRSLNERAAKNQKAQAKRQRQAADAPIVEAFECPDCGDLTDELLEWEVAVYECGCGNTFRDEGTNRCDQCNKFAAKVDEMSCPGCCEPGAPDRVQARKFDGELFLVETAATPTVAKKQTLAQAAKR